MSELAGNIENLKARIRDHSETISTEEACKTSIILPFLQALGYDVFDPSEVLPEFTADTIGKKGEKVDYAIQMDGQVRILVECKGLSTKLDKKHLSQLLRYFHVTEAKFAVLTNGRHWQFYTDLEAPNRLDNKPFLSIDLLEISKSKIQELEKFKKANFDVCDILADAERLKHVFSVKGFLAAQMEHPGEPFVKLVASEVYDGRVTESVRESFRTAIRSAFREMVRDQVQSRLSSALEGANGMEEEPNESDIETTTDEIEGMMTIRSIVSEVISPDRVDLRDGKSYCAILVDNNNRKPLARLHFNGAKKYLGVFVGKEETRHLIEQITDLYYYSGELKETARQYLE